MNMLATIVPKSDQLNADDLIGRTMTVKVTRVAINPSSEQPVSINFDGDQGKPYKPGKSMRRVLVKVWGADANSYTGRSMTLYRDDGVRFGGVDVGGIRISHMSDIDAPVVMALTEKKGSKKPFKVSPLKVEAAAISSRPRSAWRAMNIDGEPVTARDETQWRAGCEGVIAAIPTATDLSAWMRDMEPFFAPLEKGEGMQAVQHIRAVATDRMDALASSHEGEGE
jgi:hypothetical protein